MIELGLVKSFENFKTPSRSITKIELEKLTGEFALDAFRNVANGGKEYSEEEERFVNLYTKTSDIPVEHQNDFMDEYSKSKESMKNKTFFAFDTPNGVFIIGVEFNFLNFESSEGKKTTHFDKSVSQNLIDLEGNVEFVEDWDFIG